MSCASKRANGGANGSGSLSVDFMWFLANVRSDLVSHLLLGQRLLGVQRNNEGRCPRSVRNRHTGSTHGEKAEKSLHAVVTLYAVGDECLMNSCTYIQTCRSRYSTLL